MNTFSGAGWDACDTADREVCVTAGHDHSRQGCIYPPPRPPPFRVSTATVGGEASEVAQASMPAVPQTSRSAMRAVVIAGDLLSMTAATP